MITRSTQIQIAQRTRSRGSALAILCFIFILGFTISYLIFVSLKIMPFQHTALEEVALIGDSFGFVNAIFTGLALLGLVLSIFWQREDLKTSITEMQLSTAAHQQIAAGHVHERVYQHNLEILKHMSSNPEIHEAFWGRETTSHKNIRIKAETHAEMIAGLIELVVIQLEQIPESTREQWIVFSRDMYMNSPYVKIHINQNKEWYAKSMLELLGVSA